MGQIQFYLNRKQENKLLRCKGDKSKYGFCKEALLKELERVEQERKDRERESNNTERDLSRDPRLEKVDPFGLWYK